VTLSILTVAGTLPMQDWSGSLNAAIVLEFIPILFWNQAIRRHPAGYLKPRSSSPERVKGSSATVMPIPRMSLPWSAAPRCGWQRPGRSPGPCARAYGIGICSVEEIGSFTQPATSARESKKIPPQPANGNYGGPKVRDRLCQIIRQHQLDANLVKAYAVDFCGTKTLREASREQVESFVAHLADWAEKDRNALLCQLNSYLPAKEGAA
jgi:hypothetical protein